MSRNGSGSYSLPAGNPVVTGTTISSTWANTTLNDIASALTGSVASDGQTPMTGNLAMGGNNITNVGSIASTSLTDSGLTAGRITYASTGGLLADSSALTYDGTTVTATKFAGALNGTVGATTPTTGAFTTLSTSSTFTFSGLTASTALALDASKNVVSVTNTGTGNNVLSASPTLTGTIAGASLSLSSLTSGRVTYAGASGLLSDSSNLTFNGTNLGITGTLSSTGTITHSLSSNAYDTGLQLTNTNTGTSASTAIQLTNNAGNVGVFRNYGSNFTTSSFQIADSTLIYSNGAGGVVVGGNSFKYFNGTNLIAQFGATNHFGLSNGTYNWYQIIGNDYWSLQDGSLTEKLRVASSGVVTMSGYGAGTATFSASGVISSVSDETWKIKDGSPVNPDAMIQKLNPGYWFYNNEKKDIFGKDRQLGFYAQNVHEAIGKEAAPIPENYKDADGKDTNVSRPWGYYDRSILAVTVMSLKNALSTIEQLKQRITALESK